MNLYINPYKSLTVHFWYVIHKPENVTVRAKWFELKQLEIIEKANKLSLSLKRNIHLIDILKQHLKHLN